MIRTRYPCAVAIAVVLGLCARCACPGSSTGPPRLFEQQRMLMGTTFSVRLIHDDAKGAREAIDDAFDEVARVEALLSEWRESSEISEVNRLAGRQPVVVGPELLELVRRSIRISEVTGGAFDISFAACGRLWSFSDSRIPAPDELAGCLAHVGYRRIELDARRSTLRLPEEGMRIGIAGIGKGYGVDRAAERLEMRGIRDYILDGGGDIRISGSNLAEPWRVGITHPRRTETLFGAVHLDRGSIVTSGDYRNFFDRDGVRYHHLLDPATGRPARESVAVTVIAENATDADALATGLFVLGPGRGIPLAESLPGVEALIFDPALTAHRTSGFPETFDPAAGEPAAAAR